MDERGSDGRRYSPAVGAYLRSGREVSQTPCDESGTDRTAGNRSAADSEGVADSGEAADD